MRKWIVSLTALVIAGCVSTEVGMAAEAKAATLTWRFAGLNALKGKKDLVALREVTGLPEFEGFRTNLEERLAMTLATKASGAGGTNEVLLKALRAVTPDLLAYETLFEKGEGGSNICSLAIQLPAERHEVWMANWEVLAKGAKVENAKISREGAWTLVSNGTSKKILDRARDPVGDVLQMSGDGSVFKAVLPHLNPSGGILKVRPNGNGLKAEGKIEFEKDLGWKTGAWEIPVNTIRDPIGFTAVQGAADKLAELPAVKKHGSPNQLFIWGEQGNFFSVNAAAKVDDPEKFERDFADEFLKSDWSRTMIGGLEFNTNSHSLFWTGLPVAIPFMKAGHTNDGKFVMAGLFPVSDFPGERMPAGLAEQLKPNVVYYDWEASGARVSQWRTLIQLWPMSLGKPHPFYEKPADQWLTAAANKLTAARGASTTEVTKTGERELTLARQSNLGLSSWDLFRLTQWINGPPDPESALKLPSLGAPGKP